MSKSLGNVLDPNEVIERFGPDALRFYCMREVSFGQDGSVSAAGLRVAVRDRARQRLGQPRLAHAGDDRALPRRRRPRGGARPRPWSRAPTGSPGSTRSCATLLDEVELTQALEAIWVRVRRLNRYVEESRPWDLAKDESQSGRARPGALQPRRGGAGAGAAAASPTCPRRAARLLDALGEQGRELGRFGGRGGGARSSGSRRCSRSWTDPRHMIAAELGRCAT